MDEAELAKQRAEARRQKILAKQKDRLAGITGVYTSAAADPEPNTSSAPIIHDPVPDAGHVPPTPGAAGMAEAAAGATGATGMAGGAAEGVGAPEQLAAFDLPLEAQANGQLLTDVLASPRMQPDQQQQWQQEAAASLARASKLMQHTDTPAAAVAAPSQSNAALESLLNSHMMQPTSSSSMSAGGSSPAPAGVSPAVPAVVRYSRAVTLAVRDSALPRLLSAALLAYAAAAGTFGVVDYPVRLPPMAVLWLLHIAVIASVALGYILLRPSALLVEPNAASSSSEGGMPVRLRSVNLLALVPGLTELSSVVGGYQQLLAALSVDAATHVVTLGLLLAQHGPSHHGLQQQW